MTIFASIHPWHLNTDEFPYVTPQGNRRSEAWYQNSEPEATVDAAWAPRIEFTPIPVHIHSRILQIVRDGTEQFQSAEKRRTVMSSKLDALNAVPESDVTPELDHARRVLTRLVRFNA